MLIQAIGPNQAVSSVFICSPSSRPSPSGSWLMMNSTDRLIRGQIRVRNDSIGGHLVLAIGPDDRAAEAVVGHVAVVLGAEVHRAVVVPGEPEVDPLAQVALDGRKDPRHRLGILPDVLACAGAAVDPFPAPEAAVVKRVKRLGRQAVERRERAVEEPVRAASSRTRSGSRVASGRPGGRSDRPRNRPRPRRCRIAGCSGD